MVRWGGGGRPPHWGPPILSRVKVFCFQGVQKCNIWKNGSMQGFDSLLWANSFRTYFFRKKKLLKSLQSKTHPSGLCTLVYHMHFAQEISFKLLAEMLNGRWKHVILGFLPILSFIAVTKASLKRIQFPLKTSDKLLILVTKIFQLQ